MSCDIFSPINSAIMSICRGVYLLFLLSELPEAPEGPEPCGK